jgi:molybdopterin-containing oxidoreductase family molybdopterin binding subunit
MEIEMDGNMRNGVFRSVCTFVDGFTCGLSVHVKNGVIKKLTPGDFPNPVHRGACAKGLMAHHWVYHPERLRYPLRRAGKRGEGKWQRISWDEALDDISVRVEKLSRVYGPKSMSWSSPEYPFLRQGGYSRLASLLGGTWVENAGYGDLAGPCADFVTFGWFLGEIYHTSYIKEPRFAIVWGANFAFTDHQRMRTIMEHKRKGCEVVAIDPRFTETAALADEYIQIRPGTDGALALGLIHEIMNQGLENSGFIAKNTVGPLLVREEDGLFLRESHISQGGDEQVFMVWDEIENGIRRFDAEGIRPSLYGEYPIGTEVCRSAYQLLVSMVREYTPERVSAITDVPAETIRSLAVRYATQKPAAIHRGWGMQRTFHGDLSCRAINTLAGITGNVNSERTSRFEEIFTVGGAVSDFLMPAGPHNRLPVMMLYDAVTNGTPFLVKGLCIAGHNYANQLPNSNRVTKELLSNLELLLVCDLFMTSTAKYADYVLPIASHFECKDLVLGITPSVPYVQLQQKIIEPVYECRSDFRIAAGLGRRMGFGKYFERTEEEYIDDILASGHFTDEKVTVEQLVEGPVRQRAADPPYFRTPTGRIQFYVESLKQLGQELPIYMEPVESILQAKASSLGLSLLTPHHKYHMNSTLANVPELLKFDMEPILEMNPQDAQERHISDGDVVQIYNDRGTAKVRAKLTPAVKPRVVSLTQGWWPEQYLEGHHNELTHETINPAQQAVLGPNAALYDVLVEVKKAQ